MTPLDRIFTTGERVPPPDSGRIIRQNALSALEDLLATETNHAAYVIYRQAASRLKKDLGE